MPAVGDQLTLTVEALVWGGHGLARHDGLVLFIPRVLPGETVRVRVVERKRRYARAELLEITSSASGRREPPCLFFAAGCGGCSWLHIDDETQRYWKGRLVAEGLRRVLPDGAGDILQELIPPPAAAGYRNQATVRCGAAAGGGEMGFLAPGSHRIVDVYGRPAGACLVQEAANNRFLGWLARRPGPGPSTKVEVRAGFAAPDCGEPAVTVVGMSGMPPAGGPLPVRREIFLPVAGRVYRVSAAAFFQTCTRQAERLVAVVDRLVRGPREGSGLLVDLYAGGGLFSLPLAPRCKRVLAVEGNPAAVDDGRWNTRRAGLDGRISWQCGDAARGFAMSAAAMRPATVVLDPPRTGCAPDLIARLAACRVPEIVYVSCDVPTLARDLERLAGAGYRPTAVQPVDMFPHTPHVECVVRLELPQPPVRRPVAMMSGRS
ncbi:MAG: class I SAM-dependent RNA methyltransferase [Deltaproteobacteria bacterium]|nr:class I SAM-dependent RNA methyltransferase [Candidatus Anaeroferrophillacea bacterium]